ncbi:MAG: short-chain dehydrogenase [Gemmatimonadetes bacterium]|nr:short-chain dehydrogenase [Gemmatimonadota bacterium]MBT8404496.1 short-chain dehydrogenase [Gemmatimonadota bacterium]NNF37923.1 short-chain dehydrogenase [Gemmatimonadota bacterium]
MDLRDRNVLVLGGAGLVGTAVARRILDHEPRRLILSSLRLWEAEAARDELAAEYPDLADRIGVRSGDLFVPEAFKDRPRGEVFADDAARSLLVDEVYGELTLEVLERSALGRLLLDDRPDVIVDCINTAGALAYQNAFASALELRDLAKEGSADGAAVERHLATLYLPQLIRHVQIALEGMKRIGTRIYVKVGTAGTGGMGLNIPFTHSEERPSRVLLAKASLAGAHTLLLYLMARTPGAPAVKEVKPTAAISWKSIGVGPVLRGGRPIARSDAREPLALDEAFGPDAERGWIDVEGPLEGVFLDAGENGWFSPAEFEALTALGLMEFVTPEEIAENVVRELRAHPTGKDVVAALDGATLGPTYRAGVLRSRVLEHMDRLETEHPSSVAYEMLGPPRLSKVLFEADLVRRVCGDLNGAAELDPEATAQATHDLIERDDDLRCRIVSVGLPILLPDGRRLLRGARVQVPPEPGLPADHPRVVDAGWVDLRPSNWARWRERCAALRAEIADRPGLDQGSRADHDYGDGTGQLRPGRLAAWIFRYEDRGERIKR